MFEMVITGFLLKWGFQGEEHFKEVNMRRGGERNGFGVVDRGGVRVLKI